MSDVIIKTIIDLLTNDKEIIRRRYMGDFEFTEFKKFLSYRRIILILLNFFLIIVAIFTLIDVEVIIEFFFGWLVIFSVGVIIKSASLLAGIGLIFFSSYNILSLSMISKHFVLVEKKSFSINWNKWGFKDIVLNSPRPLERDKQVKFQTDGNYYVLYLILQYPNGSFGWYAITNNKSLMGKKTKRNNGKNDSNDYEIMNLIEGNNITIDHMKIKKEMVKKEDIEPSQIVGVRIRSNIQNDDIVIENLHFG